MDDMMNWMVVFWAALILGIVLLLGVSLDPRPQREQQPGEILDRRFTEGEIKFDEYQKQKIALLGEQKTHEMGQQPIT